MSSAELQVQRVQSEPNSYRRLSESRLQDLENAMPAEISEAVTRNSKRSTQLSREFAHDSGAADR